MISNKTLATILLITLNMQCAASSFSGGTQEPSPSDKPALVKKPGRASKPKKPISVLQDTNNNMNLVEVQEGSTGEVETSQELSVSQVDNQFKTLVEQGEYEKIFEIGKNMNDEELLKQLCPVIETLDQYKRVVKYLKRRKMVASFYLYADIEVVEGAIIESKVYDSQSHFAGGNLETALRLALEKDRYGRFMELLDVRKVITAENDERRKQRGDMASFEFFVSSFLENLAPWKNGMALRRFLILCGDEIRTTYHDILDTLCEELVTYLSCVPWSQSAKQLLVDLIGQSSLLTPVIFAKGFLRLGVDRIRSAFIKYGWREAIQEGLRKECYGGGEELWQVMKRERPTQFIGDFPSTHDALAVILKHFPTKQQKEEQWIEKHAPGFLATVRQAITNILPTVLIPIIIEYARPTWIDV